MPQTACTIRALALSVTSLKLPFRGLADSSLLSPALRQLDMKTKPTVDSN
jgi:hypothetical protein